MTSEPAATMAELSDALVADVARKRAAVPPAVATIVEAQLRPVHRRLREAIA